jgi:hypothetical protein
VPIPEENRGGGSGVEKYPFSKLEVGDSILFNPEPAGSGSRPAVAARTRAVRTDMKFTCRKEGTGVRIWRIK